MFLMFCYNFTCHRFSSCFFILSYDCWKLAYKLKFTMLWQFLSITVYGTASIRVATSAWTNITWQIFSKLFQSIYLLHCGRYYIHLWCCSASCVFYRGIHGLILIQTKLPKLPFRLNETCNICCVIFLTLTHDFTGL